MNILLQSDFYREMVLEAELPMLKRQLKRKIGGVEPPPRARLRKLSVEQL